MTLDEIGFYTLSDARVKQANVGSPLWRCELILTSRCNFKCPYCRRVGGTDISYPLAAGIVQLWSQHGLKNIRFSGGEPTLYPHIADLVALSKRLGIERIAVSTNGSAAPAVYHDLIYTGVNDLSISLDACCAEEFGKMSGGVHSAYWDRIVNNIRMFSKLVYVTVGIVLTKSNAERVNSIIQFAHDLGVADIRIIPAAQEDISLGLCVASSLTKAHPILKYRLDNVLKGEPVRGLRPLDSNRCGLVMDDMAVMGNKHYPCIIYLREGGEPIGTIHPTFREDRKMWALTHNTQLDSICHRNCLDVCREYNNRFARGGHE